MFVSTLGRSLVLAVLVFVPFLTKAAMIEVAILDDEFEPKFLTIAPGDTVVWRNVGGSAHTVIADDGTFDSTASGQTSIPLNATFSHTFPNAGTNPYYCQLHGGPGGQDMSGIIRVVDPSVNNPPGTPANLAPASGATNQSISPTLSASAFADADGDFHVASQWILREVLIDEVVVDTGADPVRKVSLPLTGLEHSTLYGWRVRYRDDRGEWSAYSVETQFTTVAAQEAEGTGLSASYAKYNRKLDLATVVFSTTDAAIDFDWKLGKPNRGTPANNFFVRWEGTVLPEFSERYRFRVRADGGVRLWVSGVPIIDDWVTGPFAIFRNNVVDLQAGVPVTIKLEYFDTLGNASVNLRWSSQSQPTEIIPTARLFPLSL